MEALEAQSESSKATENKWIVNSFLKLQQQVDAMKAGKPMTPPFSSSCVKGLPPSLSKTAESAQAEEISSEDRNSRAQQEAQNHIILNPTVQQW